MTNSPCGCGHDHEEAPMLADGENGGPNAERIGQKDAPVADEGCCGGGCHGCGDDTKEDACGCGHDHGHAMPAITPEEMAKLKAAIIEAGYKIEETEDGEIKIIGE